MARARCVTAVVDVGFDAPDGAITALLGPNGAGKTTTLRMVGTLVEPDAGRIACRRRRCDEQPARCARIDRHAVGCPRAVRTPDSAREHHVLRRSAGDTAGARRPTADSAVRSARHDSIARPSHRRFQHWRTHEGRAGARTDPRSAAPGARRTDQRTGRDVDARVAAPARTPARRRTSASSCPRTSCRRSNSSPTAS